MKKKFEFSIWTKIWIIGSIVLMFFLISYKLGIHTQKIQKMEKQIEQLEKIIKEKK